MALARAVSVRFDNAIRFNCALIALALVLVLVLGARMGFRLEPDGVQAAIIAPLALLAAIWVVYTRYRPDAALADFSLYAALMIIGSMVLAPLSYMNTALNFPLQDTSLAAIDLALGLNWRAFTANVGGLNRYSNFIYELTFPLIFVTMLSLLLVYGITAIKRFVTAFILTGFITCVLCGPFVAIGPYIYYSIDLQSLNGFVPTALQPGTLVDYVPTFRGLRDGTIRVISFVDGRGVVTFPSFHAVLSVLMTLCYVGRSPLQKVLLAMAIVVNGAILITVPVSGGHYFIDVIAGGVVGVAGWVISGYIVGKDGDGAPAADRSLPAGVFRRGRAPILKNPS